MPRCKHVRQLTWIAVVVFLCFPTRTLLADSGANHQIRNQHFGVSGGNVNDFSSLFCCSGTLGALVQDTIGIQ